MKPYFVAETSDTGYLVVGMNYKLSSTSFSFAVLKVNLDTTKAWFTKVMTSAHTVAGEGSMLTKADGSELYAFYNNANGAYVFLFDLSSTNTGGFIQA